MNPAHPAFPTTPKRDQSGKMDPDCYPGMTLRTYIAAKVLAALAVDAVNVDEHPSYPARAAIKLADALIAELSKS